MLLIMCHCGANRYAIDSRHVSEVLPRVHLHRFSGSPPWIAGMLICRGSATPVLDLGQLTEGTPCPDRLSSRIVVVQMELEGGFRQFGVLAESVGLREMHDEPGPSGGEATGQAALGTLHLDEQGVFQLVEIPRLVSEDRQAILFTAGEKEH
jgi:chemotaxis-related protein WspB